MLSSASHTARRLISTLSKSSVPGVSALVNNHEDISVALASSIFAEDANFRAKQMKIPVASLSKQELVSETPSWDNFFRRRGFSVTSESSMGRQLSAYLTYSLTIANIFPRVVNTKHHTVIRIDIVGARAEALAPLWVWRELRLSLCKPNQPLHIRVIGPQVPIGTKSLQEDESTGRGVSVEYHTGVYHEIFQKEEADAVFLLNPGLAHPAHKKGWKESLDYFFLKYFSKIHDAIDLNADLTMLKSSGFVNEIDVALDDKYSKNYSNKYSNDLYESQNERNDIEIVIQPELNVFKNIGYDIVPTTNSTVGSIRYIQRNWAIYGLARKGTGKKN